MRTSILFFLLIFLMSCLPDQEFVDSSMAKFDDQAYKNIISLVELHKLRNNAYPDELSMIEFVGEWDMLNYDGVIYEKLNDRYFLSIEGMVLDSIAYPDRFYNGLGIIRD